MQRGFTLFQRLTVRRNVSFNDPTTPDGKLWNSALKSITKSQGWSQLHWGTQMASEENVDLLISKFICNMSLNYWFPLTPDSLEKSRRPTTIHDTSIRTVPDYRRVHTSIA